jgi:integrase
MALMKLNKTQVDKILFTEGVGSQVLYYDIELKGFGMRVGNKTKTYFAEAKVKGRTVRVTIGKHGVLAPEQARKIAKEKLATMAQNINPNEVEKENRIKSVTLQEIYNDYIAARKSLKKTTLHDYRRCVDDYFKDWLTKPMLDITRDMVEQKHRILSERSEARANLAMRFLRALFNFSSEYRDGKGRVIIADNPVRRLSAKKIWNRIERRSNYIQPHQLKKWWDAVWTLKCKPLVINRKSKMPNQQFVRSRNIETIRDYLLVILFSGLRREEALTLSWESICFDTKTLTVRDPKNRLDHTLPMSDFLFDLFKRRKEQSINQWVFEGDGKLGRIVEPRKQMTKVIELSGIQFTSHDLRRTFASIVNMLSDTISYYTVKRLLNHKTSDVTAGYVQHDIEKLRVAMQSVTDFILNAVSRSNYE